MNILLINPPRFKSIPVIREERCEITERYSVLPPYSLLQIASLLREHGNNVSLIDANGEDLSLEVLQQRMRTIEFSVLIFRFTPTTFDWDMKVATIAKEINPNIATVGICWTLGSLARDVIDTAKDLDIYIRHEYEVTIPSFISALETNSPLSKVRGIAYRKDGKIYLTKDATPIEDYNALPLPAYDLLPNLEPYFINTPVGKPFTIIYTSKGCPFNCIYCTVAGTKWKTRSAESVLDEMRYLKEKYGIHTVSFFDETFTLDRERVTEISKKLKDEKLDIIWYCNTRANLVDAELMWIMRAGGCRGMSLGIESGSQSILDRANKHITVKQGEDAIRWAKDAGIKVYCSFILGLPGETWETIHETLDFVKRTLPTSAQFNVAVPYPGTELYEYAKHKGYINDFDWRRLYQHDAILPSEALSTEELTCARKMAYRTLYSNPHWIAQNLQHILRNPEDLILGIRYFLKIVNNYLIHGMEHAH